MSDLYARLAASHPTLQAGCVRCETCGRETTVDAAACFRDGWPTCHGATMWLLPSQGEEAGR